MRVTSMVLFSVAHALLFAMTLAVNAYHGASVSNTLEIPVFDTFNQILWKTNADGDRVFALAINSFTDVFNILPFMRDLMGGFFSFLLLSEYSDLFTGSWRSLFTVMQFLGMVVLINFVMPVVRALVSRVAGLFF